jgi:hypothetical protein
MTENLLFEGGNPIIMVWDAEIVLLPVTATHERDDQKYEGTKDEPLSHSAASA